MNKKRTIICGSKPYSNINFDNLVDSFDVIVRANKHLPGMGYGTRPSNIQVLNIHVNRNKNKNPQELYRIYKKLGVSMEHIQKFHEYVKKEKSKFVYYSDNNTSYFKKFCDKRITNQVRCGLAHVAECLKRKEKPFLIGFSLFEEDFKKHLHNKLTVNKIHSNKREIDLIIFLHNKNQIDASFCLIKDEEKISLNKGLFQPTEESLKILREIYGSVE